LIICGEHSLKGGPLSSQRHLVHIEKVSKSIEKIRPGKSMRVRNGVLSARRRGRFLKTNRGSQDIPQIL